MQGSTVLANELVRRGKCYGNIKGKHVKVMSTVECIGQVEIGHAKNFHTMKNLVGLLENKLDQ